MYIMYSKSSLIGHNSFQRIWRINEFGGLLDIELDIHWYLYIVLVLGYCGGLKGLVD